jgi:ABC-type transport system involved in multi-copper enzyme maturation permease subunit
VKALLAIVKQTLFSHLNDRWIHACALLAIGVLGASLLLSDLTSASSRVKVMLDFGLGITSLVGLVFAIFLGITTTHSDLKNKVLYFFLVKPITRWKFLLGRYLGGVSVVVCLHLVMGAALWIGMRASTDASLSGFWACLLLMACEGALVFLVAICCALLLSSTTLSALLSVLLVLLGKSNYLLMELSEKASSTGLKNLFQVLHDFLPALQRFDLRAPVAYQRPFDESLVWLGLVYFLAYSVFFFIFSGFLLQKKDIP